jgi:DnaJ-class molecular chaperone
MNHEDYDTNIETDGEKDECENCNGDGRILEYKADWQPSLAVCPECNGTGLV